MNKLIVLTAFLFCCFLSANGQINDQARKITIGMDWSEYKDLYSPSEYDFADKGPYNPILSGVASFLVPGLGQMLNAQAGKGTAIMLSHFSLIVGGFVLLGTGSNTDAKGVVTTTVGAQIGALACFTGALALDVWSICDAVRVAKIKNLYVFDCRKLQHSSVNLQIMPNFAFTPNGQQMKPAAGMTLALNF